MHNKFPCAISFRWPPVIPAINICLDYSNFLFSFIASKHKQKDLYWKMKLRFRNWDSEGKDPSYWYHHLPLFIISLPPPKKKEKMGKDLWMSLLQVFIMNLCLRMYQMTRRGEKMKKMKKIIITLALCNRSYDTKKEIWTGTDLLRD